MAFTKRHIHKDDDLGLKCLIVGVNPAVSLTGLFLDKHTIPFAFEVRRVAFYSRVIAGSVSLDVVIGTQSVLASALTPTGSATEDVPTLNATLANLRGAANAVLGIKVTTDGTGAVTNGHFKIWIRPRGMGGDAL